MLFILVDNNCILILVAASLLLPVSASTTFKSACMATVFSVTAGFIWAIQNLDTITEAA